MSRLLALAETIAMEKLVMAPIPLTRKGRAGLALNALAALLGLAATGFLIVAFRQWAATLYRPEAAALLTAGAVFVLAAVAAGAAWLVTRRRHRHRESLRQEMRHTLQTAIGAIDDELGEHIRENPAMAVMLAGLAGFLVADRAL